MIDIRKIADEADMIINGYAYTRKQNIIQNPTKTLQQNKFKEFPNTTHLREMPTEGPVIWREN